MLECDCSVTDKPASAHTPRRFKRKHVALVPFCLACLQRGIERLLGCEVSHQKLCAAVLDPLCSVVLVMRNLIAVWAVDTWEVTSAACRSEVLG